MAAFFRRIRHINWKHGSSELIGFALVLPLLAILIFTVITIIQLGLVRQTLEYTTYMSGRAAVVSDDYSTALSQAEATAKMTLKESTFGVNPDAIQVNLEVVGGTSSTSGSGIEWEKGALVKCEIIVPINQMIDIIPGSMSSCLYLMVERPAKTYY